MWHTKRTQTPEYGYVYKNIGHHLIFFWKKYQKISWKKIKWEGKVQRQCIVFIDFASFRIYTFQIFMFFQFYVRWRFDWNENLIELLKRPKTIKNILWKLLLRQEHHLPFSLMLFRVNNLFEFYCVFFLF